MNTYYIIGDAQVASNNPIQQQYGTFFVGLEVNVHGHIVEASCNAILPSPAILSGAFLWAAT